MRNICRKIVFYVFVTLIYTASIPASAQLDSVFSIPYPQRYEALYFLIRSNADSARDFPKAAKLLEIARKRHDERDELCIEQGILGLEEDSKVDLPHLEQKAAKLIKRAEQINCYPIRAYVYTTLGHYYYKDVHNYALAFRYYLLAYNDYHNLHKEQFPDMSRTQYSLASAYYKFYDYRKSLKYGKEILHNDISNSVWLELLVNDLIGMSYIKLQEYDSAIVYFQKTLELAPGHHAAAGAIAWQGIATGNIGLAWYLQKNYDKAIPYLLKGVALSDKGEVPDNTASFAVYLSDIYLERKDMAAAGKYLQIAHDATWKANDLQIYCDLYKALSAFYRQQGNAALTLQYQDSSLVFKDSLAVITDVNKKYSAEITVAEERNTMNEQILAKEKQKQILLRNALIIFTCMAMVFILLFYNRKLLKQKHRREQLLAEKLITETELAGAKRQLEDFTRHITEKNELIESLREKTAGSSDPGIIQQLQQSTLLTDEQWDNFRDLFEKAHAGYLYRLKEKMPGLTPAETRFMALSKLKLSNKEMSAMLGNSPDAIRQYRSRLRKKFNIPEENNIEDVADAI
jgi:tetratricopeptide (TPR) repeat protein